MAAFEGITEAVTWNLRDGTAEVNTGRYHGCRLFEMLGAVILGWIFIRLPALSQMETVILILSLVCIYYLPYQVFLRIFRVYTTESFQEFNPERDLFLRERKDWDVEILPGVVILIPHPPMWMNVIIYIVGMILLFTNI